MTGSYEPGVPPARNRLVEEARSLAEEHDRILSAGRLHWFHWLIVGASLLLTIVAWYFVQTQVDQRIKNRFDQEAREVVALVVERMQKYEDALWSGVAAIHAHGDEIDRRGWKRFSETLKIDRKYPGINGIGVIYHLRPGEVAAFLAKQRIDRPGFKIFPPHSHNEFFPITYTEPSDLNEAAIGLDLAHETNRYTAARNARDTGKPRVTGPITLVQDAGRTPGFELFVPFYSDGPHETVEARRRNFIGIVYGAFIFKNLMHGTLDSDRRVVGIRITDGDDVLYNENDAELTNRSGPPRFTKAISIQEFGRKWDFEIISKKSFDNISSNQRPWLILLGGGVIDAMLLALLLFLARSNRQAVEFADRMNHQFQARTIRLSAIIEHARSGLITIDEDELIESFNPACERIFGYTAEEAIGRNIRQFIPEPYGDDGDQNHGFARKAEGRTKSGEIVLLELAFSEITIAGGRLLSGIVHDITEQDKAETEILNKNLELERFAYIASHDLQEPLRMVSSFTALLQEEYGDRLDDQARQYMDWTVQSSRRMQNLVADLLEYSLASSDEGGFSDFDSGEQIAAVVENLGDAMKVSGAKIKVGDMPVIYANPLRFGRLLQNLVGNAIKYRANDRIPEIEIKVQEGDREWVFSVCDNGLGIRPEYFEQIFVIFKRLHNKEEYSGTGIGLSICQKIVENFGGRIWVESEPGRGSQFFFSVPKRQKDREAA